MCLNTFLKKCDWWTFCSVSRRKLKLWFTTSWFHFERNMFISSSTAKNNQAKCLLSHLSLLWSSKLFYKTCISSREVIWTDGTKVMISKRLLIILSTVCNVFSRLWFIYSTTHFDICCSGTIWKFHYIWNHTSSHLSRPTIRLLNKIIYFC